ncbi:MAG: hypothetical protein WCF67_19935 [Chitinophagaceae bacterium]
MKHSSFLQPLFLLVFFSGFVFTSCKKKKLNLPANTTSIAEVRTTGNINTVSLDFGAGNQQATLLTLESTNSSPVTVRLSTDNAPVTAARLMPLPASSYTALTLQHQVPANGTLPVQLMINKTNLTADTTYGLYFKIEEVSAGNIVAGAKTLLVKITLRNRWDGRYRVTGTMTDVTQPTYAFREQEVMVITTGTTQVKVIPKELGIVGLIIKVGINDSFYGNFGPVLNFTNDNKISSIVNSYGQPAPNGRSAELDPSGSNSWTASNKTMNVKFWMNEPSVATPHRAAFTTTWTYLGER